MKKRHLSAMKKRDLFYFFSVAAMVDIRLCVHLPSTTVTGIARKSSSVLKCVVKQKTRLSIPPILNASTCIINAGTIQNCMSRVSEDSIVLFQNFDFIKTKRKKTTKTIHPISTGLCYQREYTQYFFEFTRNMYSVG